jgi:hypothetical protein
VEHRFRLRRRGATWLYFGECPRCCHPIDVVVDRSAFGVDDSVTIDVVCNCVGIHAGAPTDRPGCGRSARVQLEVRIVT